MCGVLADPIPMTTRWRSRSSSDRLRPVPVLPQAAAVYNNALGFRNHGRGPAFSSTKHLPGGNFAVAQPLAPIGIALRRLQICCHSLPRTCLLKAFVPGNAGQCATSSTSQSTGLRRLDAVSRISRTAEPTSASLECGSSCPIVL